MDREIVLVIPPAAFNLDISRCRRRLQSLAQSKFLTTATTMTTPSTTTGAMISACPRSSTSLPCRVSCPRTTNPTSPTKSRTDGRNLHFSFALTLSLSHHRVFSFASSYSSGHRLPRGINRLPFVCRLCFANCLRISYLILYVARHPRLYFFVVWESVSRSTRLTTSVHYISRSHWSPPRSVVLALARTWSLSSLPSPPVLVVPRLVPLGNIAWSTQVLVCPRYQ